MFPLHQSNELCFQISPNPDNKECTISTEDLIDLSHDSASLNQDCHVSDQIQRSSRNLFPSLSNNNNNANNNNPQRSNDVKDKKNKKIKHRDIERQRRQDMASLHASLRSHLPLQFIKGKRSISDHIHEAARYIKILHLKIKELGAKRDELIKLGIPGSANAESTELHDELESSEISNQPPWRLTVHPCCGGVEIGIATAGDCKEGYIGKLPLSRVLEVLLGEGLSIVSCVSTKVNGRFLYNIHSEASTRESINTSALEQKLNQMILHRWDIRV